LDNDLIELPVVVQGCGSKGYFGKKKEKKKEEQLTDG